MKIRRLRCVLTAAALAMLLLGALPAPGAAAASPKKPVQAMLTLEDLIILWSDGTVSSTGNEALQPGNAADWKDIRALCGGTSPILGLRSDGTLCGAVSEAFPEAAAWSDVEYAASTGTHLLALKKDGTVLCAGPGFFGTRESYSFSDWKDVAQLIVGHTGSGEYAVGLLKDGSIRDEFLPKYWTAEPKHTAAVSCSGYLLLCLQEDGTVAASGQDAEALGGQIAAWRDVTQVLAGDSLALGLRRDGTVLAASTWNEELIEALSAWRDVRSLYLSPDGVVFGVHKDGSVSVEPKEELRFSPWAVECWTDVDKLLCADESRVAAVSKSGELLSAGTFVPGAAAPSSPREVTDSQGRYVESVMQTYGTVNRADGPALRWDGQGLVTQMVYGSEAGSRGIFTWRYDAKGRLTAYRMEAREPLPSGAEHVIEHSIALRYASDGGVTAEVTRRVSSGGGTLHRQVYSFDAEGELVRFESSDKDGGANFGSGSVTLENVLHDW